MKLSGLDISLVDNKVCYITHTGVNTEFALTTLMFDVLVVLIFWQ